MNVCTLCFDLSMNEASEPKGVCSCKNYLKTCQDATTRAWVPRLFGCLLFTLPVCVFEIAAAGVTHLTHSGLNVCFPMPKKVDFLCF